MIKKFKSYGVVGLPDSDLTFDDSKIILIQGPNGAGKSTLLRHITNPYRSSNNRSVSLRDDVDNGYIEQYFEYNNIDYKIIHTIDKVNRKGEVAYTNKSYLQKKINGTYVDLVKDGGVNTFTREVEKEFNYNKAQHSVLNIGVNNFGLLKLTNSDRLSYMKSLLNIEIIDDLIKIVSEKQRNLMAELRVLDRDISNSEDPKILESNIEIKTNGYRSNIGILKALKKDMGDLVDPEKIDRLVNLHKEKENDINDIKSIIDVLNILNEDKSYDDISNEYIFRKAELNTNINNKSDEIIYIASQIEEAKNTNIDSLLKEKESLLEKLNNQKDMGDIYNKYKHVNPLEIESYVNSIRNIFMSDSVDYIFMKNIIENYDEFIRTGKKNTEVINSLEKEIADKTLILNNATYQENIVCITPHKDTPHECGLYQEWARQINNKDIHFNTLNELNELQQRLEKESEILIEMKRVGSMYNRISSVHIPEYFNLIVDDLTFILDEAKVRNVYDKIDMIKLSINMENDKNILKDKLSNIENQIDLLNKQNSQSVTKFEERQKQLIEEREVYNKELKDLDIKVNILKRLDKNTSNKYNTFNKISLENALVILNDEINDITTEKDKLISKREFQIQKKSKIEEIEELQLVLNSEITLLKHKLNEINEKNKKRMEVDVTLAELKNVNTIMKGKLSLDMMKNSLRKIENISNDLLNDFMSIHFDLSEGTLDINCERQGIYRTSDVLSSGEASMLSIAMMMAMKRYIPWDIVSIDEGSAMLDEKNKDKFINMITVYARAIPSISQIFLVSHDVIIDEGMDMMKIQIKDGVCHQ